MSTSSVPDAVPRSRGLVAILAALSSLLGLYEMVEEFWE
jgi:hypothetical protein